MTPTKWPANSAAASPVVIGKNPFLPMTPMERLLIRLDLWTRKCPKANRTVRWLWNRFITPSQIGREV